MTVRAVESRVSEVISHLQALAALARTEGGWGYTPAQEAHLEPTCLALLALSLEPDRFRDVIAQGRVALDCCAALDGTYRLGRGREEAVWPTARVLFIQAALDYPRKEIRQTAARLLT